MFYLSENILRKYSGFSTDTFIKTGFLECSDKIVLYSYKWYIPNKVLKFKCVGRDIGDSREFSHSDSFIHAVDFISKYYQPEIHI